MRLSRALVVLLALAASSCASYRTPGAPARLLDADPAEVREGARQPSPEFPLTLAVVRVQAGDYRSASTIGSHRGSFSVVSDAQLFDKAQLKTIAGWPRVEGAALLDTALLPEQLNAIDELRLAAAKMQADVLVVYTVATQFARGDSAYAPLAKLPLDDQSAELRLRTLVSAVLVDVRTGYNYGAVQAEAGAAVAAKARTPQALDAQRLEVERLALERFLQAGEQQWAQLLRRYQ